MPENGDPILYLIILVATIIDIALVITFSILSTAMIADVVEDGEVRTKRRSEGVLFALGNCFRIKSHAV
jgi:GPH family glycoside/pentoside/hexuronide:cation symporter